MYMVFIEVCLWTLLAFVLTWTTYHVTNRRKKTTKLADAAVEEIRDGGPDVIVVGAGVGGSALAYALAKVINICVTVKRPSITSALHFRKPFSYSICT